MMTTEKFKVPLFMKINKESVVTKMKRAEGNKKLDGLIIVQAKKPISKRFFPSSLVVLLLITPYIIFLLCNAILLPFVMVRVEVHLQGVALYMGIG